MGLGKIQDAEDAESIRGWEECPLLFQTQCLSFPECLHGVLAQGSLF